MADHLDKDKASFPLPGPEPYEIYISKDVDPESISIKINSLEELQAFNEKCNMAVEEAYEKARIRELATKIVVAVESEIGSQTFLKPIWWSANLYTSQIVGLRDKLVPAIEIVIHDFLKQ